MKRMYVLLAAVFLLTGCPSGEREIEDTMSTIREANDSSHNIYIQYYYKPNPDNEETLERLRLDAHSEYKHDWYVINYRYSPYYTFDNPNEYIKKIIIVDTDSHKMLKKIEDANGFFELEKAENDYDMLVRREHYLFTITDELFEEH
ncbi:hypothetical protein AGMMS50267_12570 [Spirochaetia bacterium]|nr:hypothetical protein AGMMS50267_12570 [Spirochaetia bacterium]